MTIPPASLPSPILITVFTGFLGTGKTSIILSLLPQLPPDYCIVLLKNEFGVVEVDSQLVKQSSLVAVSEILNGCMCCILVGQMKTALLEILKKYRSDRIIIECSSVTSFPAMLTFQICELECEMGGKLKLDVIVTVIDVKNFVGYEDSSPTTQMQASYTDIILINKSEHISERTLDILVDHLNTLNDLTLKGVNPRLIFGLDSKLFLRSANMESVEVPHHEEVKTVTVYAGSGNVHTHVHSTGCGCMGDHEEMHPTSEPVDKAWLEEALSSLSKEMVWWVNGFVRLSQGPWIVNWAFGWYDVLETGTGGLKDGDGLLVTVIGEHGDMRWAA
ncbi:cobW-domain-containing protein [Laetiporus sulphureus 93-53]|uniref:CobW-domain-containing protein n=1 Tax=Laetiporus sulphureus 93-53 TaxID=1314785 RepID=A0A165EVA6_9APHY|nr:cobW-domain-containing protein [Laetiporus sulphureus 93-53]KZT07835.1 cobW-domain-containing protein [Laetiporus sulphureus 93-53]